MTADEYSLMVDNEVELPDNSDSNEESENESPRGQGRGIQNFQSPRSSSYSPHTGHQPAAKIRKLESYADKQTELIEIVSDYLKKRKNQTPQDEYYENVAKVWAYKLKELDPSKRKFTEKKINDLFFEAEMEDVK